MDSDEVELPLRPRLSDIIGRVPQSLLADSPLVPEERRTGCVGTVFLLDEQAPEPEETK